MLRRESGEELGIFEEHGPIFWFDDSNADAETLGKLSQGLFVEGR